MYFPITAIETDCERASQRSARVVRQWVRSVCFGGGREKEEEKREREKK